MVHGRVYRIYNSLDDLVYVGSTTQTLSRRFSAHKLKAKAERSHLKCDQHWNEIGWDHVHIEILEEGPYQSKDFLRKAENKWIKEMDTIRNGLNSVAAHATEEEKRDQKKEYTQTYNAENRTEILAKKKVRYIRNKTIGFPCELCGVTFTQPNNLQTHYKTLKHKYRVIAVIAAEAAAEEVESDELNEESTIIDI
jgi:hypothetical protein